MSNDKQKNGKEQKKVKSNKPSLSKVTCTKCNKVLAVRPEIAKKRIEKAGSEEKYRQNYKCRNCRPSKK